MPARAGMHASAPTSIAACVGTGPVHEHHARARKAFRNADDVLLHPCILAEFTTVVRRNAKDAGEDGAKAARLALRALLHQPRVRVVHDIDHGAAVRRFLARPRLSFADAILLEVARKEGKRVVSFGRGRRGSAIPDLLVQDPLQHDPEPRPRRPLGVVVHAARP